MYAFDLVTCNANSEESPFGISFWRITIRVAVVVVFVCLFPCSPSISISSLIHLVSLRQAKVDFATYVLPLYMAERHLKLKMNQMQSSGTTSKVKLIIITHYNNKEGNKQGRLRSNGRSLPKLERSVASNLPDVEHEYVSSINLCWSKVSDKHHHQTKSHLGRKLIMTQSI